MRGVWADGQGFVRPIVNDRANAQWFLSDFDDSWHKAQENGYSRLHVSAMFTEAGLLALRHQNYAHDIVEAITPLDWRHERQKLFWLQFGMNTDARYGETLSQSEVLDMVGKLKEEKPWSFKKIHERISPEYHFEELTDASGQDIDDLQKVWTRFGYTSQEVMTFIQSPFSYIRVARYGGRIVATARLELTRFTQGGVSFECAEHTDAATLTEHEGNGLYAALLSQTQVWLNSLAQPPDIMYGVSNADQPSVLRLARRVGRNFAVHDGLALGFPNSGVLCKDSPISVEDGVPEFRDLLMSYHTPSSLASWVRDSHVRELR